MYDRLTIRHPHPYEDFITINETKQLPDTEQSRKVLNRLCDLEDKICEGKIVEMPCKVGQWVYVPWRWEGQQAVAIVKVEEIKFYDSSMHYMFFIDMESDVESFNQLFCGWKIGDSIGKTVFLTREEAERALERSENGK